MGLYNSGLGLVSSDYFWRENQWRLPSRASRGESATQQNSWALSCRIECASELFAQTYFKCFTVKDNTIQQEPYKGGFVIQDKKARKKGLCRFLKHNQSSWNVL